MKLKIYKTDGVLTPCLGSFVWPLRLYLLVLRPVW